MHRNLFVSSLLGTFGAVITLSPLIAVLVCSGCAESKPPKAPIQQATMPSIYVEGIIISKMHDGEMLHADADYLVVDYKSKVWISDEETTRKPSAKADLTIYKKDGLLYVVVKGKSTFKPRKIVESNLGNFREVDIKGYSQLDKLYLRVAAVVVSETGLDDIGLADFDALFVKKTYKSKPVQVVKD